MELEISGDGCNLPKLTQKQFLFNFLVDFFTTNIKLLHRKILLLTNEGCTMKISRMNPLKGESKTAAFFDIETEEEIIIKGFRIVNGPSGLFISAPDEKGKDGKFYDRVILPKEIKEKLEKMALDEYAKIKGS